MHHQTAYELFAGECDIFQNRAVFVVFCGKGNTLGGDGFDPGIGNGDAVCIPSKIFNGITEPVKGLPDIRAPLFLVEGILKLLPDIGITQLFTGRKTQPAVKVVLVDTVKQLPPEFITKYFCRNKEAITGFFQFHFL